MDKKEILLKEYEEGNKVCMHYESFRRQGLHFFIIVQGAIISIVFLQKVDNSIFETLLSFFGLFVSLLTVNNDIRVIGYYKIYIERLKEIEDKLGMKLFTDYNPKSKFFKFSIGNKFYYRGLPLLASLFWLVSLFYEFK